MMCSGMPNATADDESAASAHERAVELCWQAVASTPPRVALGARVEHVALEVGSTTGSISVVCVYAA